MEAAADVVWAALQANTQVRVDKLCYGPWALYIKSTLEKGQILIASAAGTSNSDVCGSKSVNMFRVKGGTGWKQHFFSYLPKVHPVMSLGG